MTILFVLDWLSELIQLVFELGEYTRKYILPAIVYAYVFVDYYITPTVIQLVRFPEHEVRLPLLAKTSI